MLSTGDTFDYPFDVLAHFTVAQAIFAAYEVGIWEPFESDTDYAISVDEFSEQKGTAPRETRGLMEYLARRGYFYQERGIGPERFRLGPKGHALISQHWLGYFVFLVGGYGEVLRSGGAIASGKLRYGTDVVRNGHYVALGSELQGRHPQHRSFDVVLEAVKSAPPPETLLDIGCGSATFLINLMRASHAKHGIGIDIAPDACSLAETNARDAGLSDRVRIICGNAFNPADIDSSLEHSIDLVTAMFVIHEVFMAGSSDTIAVLKSISRLLKHRTGRLIIMDKQTDVLDAGEAPPYFSEFKLVHDLTNQKLMNNAYWKHVLTSAGLTIVSERALGPLSGTVNFVCSVG